MSENKENLILFDWLSLTSKVHTFDQIAYLLGLDSVPWECGYSPRYECRWYYGSISIHCMNERPGIWFEMSGQGCRTFESEGHGDYSVIFSFARQFSDDINVTRLDVAFDDHTGLLDIRRIYDDVVNQKYVSRSTSWTVELSDHGSCVYIGSHQSTVMFRIYDKAAERNISDEHWIRCEMQLRNARCMKFLELVGEIGLQSAYRSVLINYLRFVVEDENDSNKSRWPMAQYWSDLINDALPRSIYVAPGLEYNVDRCENYVYRIAGNAIDALLQVYDGDVSEFLSKLGSRDTKPNPKYKTMIREARVARGVGVNDE